MELDAKIHGRLILACHGTTPFLDHHSISEEKEVIVSILLPALCGRQLHDPSAAACEQLEGLG